MVEQLPINTRLQGKKSTTFRHFYFTPLELLYSNKFQMGLISVFEANSGAASLDFTFLYFRPLCHWKNMPPVDKALLA